MIDRIVENTKAVWRCPSCGKDGCVEHPENESVASVLAKVIKQHEDVSPICTVSFEKLQILR